MTVSDTPHGSKSTKNKERGLPWFYYVYWKYFNTDANSVIISSVLTEWWIWCSTTLKNLFCLSCKAWKSTSDCSRLLTIL